MISKERMAGLIDSFISDMSLKYKPEQRGEDYLEIKVDTYGVKDTRSPLKARTCVHAYINDAGESPIYVFQTVQDANGWIMKHRDFEQSGLYQIYEEHWADIFEERGVMTKEEALDLIRKKAWKDITRIMLQKCGAEHFLSLGVPPYRYRGFVFYTYVFEDDEKYPYMHKQVRINE